MNITALYKKIILVLFVLTFAVVVFFNHKEILVFLQYLEDSGRSNLLVTSFMIIAIKTITAPLGIPGTPLTLIVGSLLGTYLGTVVSIIGNTLGATLAFLLSRYIFRDYIQTNILSRYPKIEEYENRLEHKAVSTVITLRLIPLFPFNALNFLLGVTNISLRDYVLGSFIGMIPGTFIYVYFGESIRMLSPINIVLAVSGLLLLIYLGKQYGKRS